MARWHWALMIAGALTGGAVAADGKAPTPEQAEFFEKRVRPVLAEHCLSCHGAKKQMSGLRLDSREALLRGGDNGPVVEPGRPDRSPLVRAVRHEGDRKMPPKRKLDPAQADALAAWVKMGAPWPATGAVTGGDADAWKRHWAFRPVATPPPPAVRRADWPRTRVDRFILSRLEVKGLTPSPAADRRTLVRRATFDLLGLPPTPEEVAAFEADRSPDAWEKVVDRLLASPHYGERWGRHWLDVARYADTKGYVFFEEAEYPWAWTYRDYVIRAFNEDLPYDRFVLEQLAADRLDLGGDKRPLTAMGFLVLGGRFMSNVHDILDDRIDVVTRGLLGLTVSCARCHDHKFDPVPTRDYYSLYGVFASAVEPTVPPLFFDPPRTAEYEKFEKELKGREQKLAQFVRAKHDEVVAAAKKRAAEYLQAVLAMRDQPDTEEFMLIADGSDLNPTMLTRWRAYVRRTQRANSPVFAAWHVFAALPEKDFAARAKVAVKQLASGPVNARVLQAFTEKPPANMADVARRYGEQLNAVEEKWQAAVKCASDAKTAAPSALPDAAEEELRQVFHGPGAAPNVSMSLFGDLALLPDRPSQGKLQELRKAVEQWRATGPGAPPRAMVLTDLPTPVEPRVFVRGSPNNLGEAVPRRFLEVLAGKDRRSFTEGSGRLELARAIASKDNPLTARVMVNRVWAWHFGEGLVRTPSDFGLRSEPPTHPELLDHLATAFMAGGWSLKKLHRLILLSAVYQQQSIDRPECRRIDPENALLWRMNRRRLDFEATRDALLAVSGRLDRRVGGPSVKDLLSASANRRTLYGHLDRLNVPGLYRTFDFPSPDATSPQRAETTVPQQALFLMNSLFAQDCARQLIARSDVGRIKDAGGRVGHLHRLLFGRAPGPDECRLAEAFLRWGNTSPASWESYAQALLLTNEFLFVD